MHFSHPFCALTGSRTPGICPREVGDDQCPNRLRLSSRSQSQDSLGRMCRCEDGGAGSVNTLCRCTPEATRSNKSQIGHIRLWHRLLTGDDEDLRLDLPRQPSIRSVPRASEYRLRNYLPMRRLLRYISPEPSHNTLNFRQDRV